MKCLRLIGKQESCQFSYKNHLFCPFLIESLYLYLLCLSAALLCYSGFLNYSLIRSTSCSCSTCCIGLGFQLQNLQDFIKISTELIKDIFPVATFRTWPIRSVQVQLGSVAHPKSKPPLRAASGSQEDPEHRRANQNPPRTTPLTMETLAAHRTACNGAAGQSKPQSPGRPVRPLLLRFLEVMKNKKTYAGGWTSSCSTRSTTSPP